MPALGVEGHLDHVVHTGRCQLAQSVRRCRASEAIGAQHLVGTGPARDVHVGGRANSRKDMRACQARPADRAEAHCARSALDKHRAACDTAADVHSAMRRDGGDA